MGSDPTYGNCLARSHNIRLQINTLDTNKTLRHTPSNRTIRPPTRRQLLCLPRNSTLNLPITRQTRKQMNETQRIIQITQSIRKPGITLPHKMMQRILGSQRFLPASLILLMTIGTPTNFLHEGAELTEFIQQRLMSQRLDILNMIKHLPLFVLGSLLGLTGIHSLENAQAAKVTEGNLQFLEDLGTSNKGGVESGVVAFTDLSHAGEFLLLGAAGVDGGLDGLFLRAAFDAVTHFDVVVCY
mmetsp:Transcript_29845/g.50916  ORF Transcript_29845/g.50916 Transcript_29845/m.50916 type:complete len:242 (-) Transcript_29845:106-831(-)